MSLFSLRYTGRHVHREATLLYTQGGIYTGRYTLRYTYTGRHIHRGIPGYTRRHIHREVYPGMLGRHI